MKRWRTQKMILATICFTATVMRKKDTATSGVYREPIAQFLLLQAGGMVAANRAVDEGGEDAVGLLETRWLDGGDGDLRRLSSYGECRAWGQVRGGFRPMSGWSHQVCSSG